jgi:hypothetical protein
VLYSFLGWDAQASMKSKNTIKVRFSLILIVLFLQIAPSPLPAADANGRYERYCDGWFFYLSNVDGLPASEKLVLFLRMNCPPCAVYTPEEVWWTNVFAQRCSADGKCKDEDATSSRIWLDKGASEGKRISGKFEVDFDGQLLKGQFVTKEGKPKQVRICE